MIRPACALLISAALACPQQRGGGRNLLQPLPELEKSLHGKLEKIKVHGKSLEGNLEGDSADRDVFVYLPPSYGTDKNRRYPVLFLLHGYGVSAERYWTPMTVPATADQSMGGGSVHEMILVNPDANTIYNG